MVIVQAKVTIHPKAKHPKPMTLFWHVGFDGKWRCYRKNIKGTNYSITGIGHTKDEAFSDFKRQYLEQYEQESS